MTLCTLSGACENNKQTTTNECKMLQAFEYRTDVAYSYFSVSLLSVWTVLTWASLTECSEAIQNWSITSTTTEITWIHNKYKEYSFCSKMHVMLLLNFIIFIYHAVSSPFLLPLDEDCFLAMYTWTSPYQVYRNHIGNHDNELYVPTLWIHTYSISDNVLCWLLKSLCNKYIN